MFISNEVILLYSEPILKKRHPVWDAIHDLIINKTYEVKLLTTDQVEGVPEASTALTLQ